MLIHELDHALRTKYKAGKTSVKIYGEAIKQMPDEKLASIIKTYEKVDTKLANKNAQYADEANAYYAEMTLGNMDVLRYLVADHPSLKQRILSFFKKAAVDYAGTPKLEGYAKKYLKQYKKAFDQLASENTGTLALAETVDDASAAVESGARQYAAEITAKMSETEKATGKAVAEFIENVNQMADKAKRTKRKMKIGTLSAQHIFTINALMQTIDSEFSAEGYELWIDGTSAQHIEARHGEHGEADTTMATKETKSLIPWVAQNAEAGAFITDSKGNIRRSDRFFNKDGSKAPEIRLEKSTDQGVIYVSECVPDSANKRIWVTSAYANKKGSKGQLLNMEDNTSPQPTPEASFDGIATTIIIPDPATKVNPSDEKSSGKVSDLDSEYLSVVESGDMDTAQKMVDEAAKKAGYAIKAYHGTSNEFTTFRQGNKRTRGSLNFGSGFYFSPSRTFAENYTTTGRVIEGYLKMEKPYEVYGTRFYLRDLEMIAKEAGKEVTIDNVKEILQQMGYDGIIAKDYDGTTNPINQYVIYEANQVKSADAVTYDDAGNVIPLSQRFDPTKTDIRYSLTLDSAKITADMTEQERYDALKERILENIPVSVEVPASIAEKVPEISSWEDLNKYFGKDKRALIRKIASEFGVIGKEYFNGDIQVSFEFSANSFRESYSKQGRNFTAFAKMLSVFDSVVENAVGIETHKRSNYKPDPTLDAVFVLMSAYQDGDSIVPVKLEVKKFKDKQNTLYVAISLEKIKMTEVWKQGNTETGVTQNSRSVTISIADLFKKINPSDENFLKYVPDGFLNAEQLDAKKRALAKDAAKGTVSKQLSLPLEPLTPDEAQAQEDLQRDVPRKKHAKKSAKERTEAKLKEYFSTEGSYEMLRSVYGLKDLSPSSIQEMSNQIWRALNSSVSADEKALIAWNTAGFILDRMMTTDLTKENPAAHAAMEELAYLRTGIGRLKFADTDVAELKHAFGKDGMAKIRGRWGYKGKGVAYPMEQFVVDIAREMPGMAYLEEMHPAEAFKAIMERYDTAVEASKEKWISELDGATA